MAKQGGMGDNLYVGGFDLSGDIGALSKIGGGPASLVVTGINKYGYERLGGLRTGEITYQTWFNDAAGAAHPVLSTLPTTDEITTYCRGTLVGSFAASQVSQRIGYDPTRGTDGSLTFAVSAQSNGFGIEWGRLLTAGLRTDTTATSPASGYDTAAAASFGGQFYLHVTAFTGTSVTVKLQDSADNVTFADLSGAAFVAATAVGAQRISIVNTATIRRYVRVITTGTFTNAVFAVNMIKNENAGVVF